MNGLGSKDTNRFVPIVGRTSIFADPASPVQPRHDPRTFGGNTGYTDLVAKVMVSLPDDLLRAVDVEAERRGTTRSGLLRELAEETLRRRTIHRAERMAQINDLDGPIKGHGGRVAELVKANRPEP